MEVSYKFDFDGSDIKEKNNGCSMLKDKLNLKHKLLNKIHLNIRSIRKYLFRGS